MCVDELTILFSKPQSSPRPPTITFSLKSLVTLHFKLARLQVEHNSGIASQYLQNYLLSLNKTNLCIRIHCECEVRSSGGVLPDTRAGIHYFKINPLMTIWPLPETRVEIYIQYKAVLFIWMIMCVSHRNTQLRTSSMTRMPWNAWI